MLDFKYTEWSKEMGYNDYPIEQFVGDIPFFVQTTDGRKAQEQINERYSFGGGWRPLKGWNMNPETKVITFVEEDGSDPPLNPIVVAKYKEQEIYVYQHAWVAIVEKDGTFEIGRMD